MGTIADLFDLAVRYHQSGDLRKAEPLYRQILQADPSHADAHHFLGLIAYQTGHLDGAVGLMSQALVLNPSAAVYHANLGVVFQAQGRPQEAQASFAQALRLNPDLADTHNNLGNVLQEQGKLDEASACYRQALRLNPDHASGHYNLANALKDQGQLDEAVTSYRQALRIDPHHVDAHNNLGVAFKALGRLDEAVACYQQALGLNPNHVDARNNLGNIFKDQDRLDEAVACYREVLRLNPQYVDALSNLGLALKEQGQLAEAVACCRRALGLNPRHANAHNNLGLALMDQGQLGEAGACFDQALRLRPQDAGPRWNWALLRLLQGNFEQGWADYESRWSQPGLVPRSWPRPRWDGLPLEGKTILVHAEQGLGDTLQFIRYAPLVKRRGGTVLVECQPALVTLLSRCPGIDRVLPEGTPLPDFDVQVPLLSLPGLFGTNLSCVPADVPYLFADNRLVERWRRELAGFGTAFRIGLVWQGNPTVRGDRQRSVPLIQFAPLACLEGVRLFSLQVGPGAKQLVHTGERLGVVDLGSRFDRSSLEDVAAVLKNLDLVISSCTAIPHLAGALGVPVWLALAFVPDWRWLLEREDSPWYPHHRLFRQRRPGDWDEVFKRIAAELRSLSKTCKGR